MQVPGRASIDSKTGALLEMDRVEGLPPSAEKKATKKKPAKSGEAKSGVGNVVSLGPKLSGVGTSKVR